jgi:hypothetical protein
VTGVDGGVLVGWLTTGVDVTAGGEPADVVVAVR